MAFKLGSSRNKYNIPGKTQLFKKKLDNDVIAEANIDGTIYIDEDVDLNSSLGRRAIKHEMKHIEQMEEGRASYSDDTVMWEGKLYFRKEVDGEAVIDGPNGRWPEGHPNHPWEAEAIAAEKE
mgnify:CR=1 FL=1